MKLKLEFAILLVWSLALLLSAAWVLISPLWN